MLGRNKRKTRRSLVEYIQPTERWAEFRQPEFTWWRVKRALRQRRFTVIFACRELGTSDGGWRSDAARQLMRRARQRIAKRRQHVIRTSVSTFMGLSATIPTPASFVARTFRHFSGGVSCRRRAKEIQHFIAELADYLELENHMPRAFTLTRPKRGNYCLLARARRALDIGAEQRRQLEKSGWYCNCA